MIDALLDAWPLIALVVYGASAAVGVAFSVGNLRTMQRSMASLRLLEQNGASMAAASGFRKLHLYLLGAQVFEGVLVVASVAISGTGTGTARGQTAFGVAFSAILIAINLFISLASVASTNGYRRARAYVRAEEMAEARGWDGTERRTDDTPPA